MGANQIYSNLAPCPISVSWSSNRTSISDSYHLATPLGPWPWLWPLANWALYNFCHINRNTIRPTVGPQLATRFHGDPLLAFLQRALGFILNFSPSGLRDVGDQVAERISPQREEWLQRMHSDDVRHRTLAGKHDGDVPSQYERHSRLFQVNEAVESWVYDGHILSQYERHSRLFQVIRWRKVGYMMGMFLLSMKGIQGYSR